MSTMQSQIPMPSVRASGQSQSVAGPPPSDVACALPDLPCATPACLLVPVVAPTGSPTADALPPVAPLQLDESPVSADPPHPIGAAPAYRNPAVLPPDYP